MGIVFRDPPLKYTSWQKRLRPLLSRPTEWALVAETRTPEQAHTQASSLRTGRFKIPEAVWEFTSRATEDGTGEVYARCLEPKNEPAPVGAAG